MPSWLPHKQVNLGLDLQGGAHLLYQLDEKEMVEDWLDNVQRRCARRASWREDRDRLYRSRARLCHALRLGEDPQTLPIWTRPIPH